jgi:hypothetical protein
MVETMQNLFAVSEPARHWGCRVNDQIIWNGMRAVLIQNELLQILILVDKGTEIIQFLYKPLDVDFLWRSPNELHNPAAFSTPAGDDSSPFFDHWSGGWFEVIPNNGPGSPFGNTRLGFFAETVNIPWHYKILEDTPERVRVGFWVRTYRTPFLLHKTLTLETGKPALFIEEQLTNTGKEEVEFVWGHHPVVGPPFLSEDCRIAFPDSKVIVMADEDGPGYRMKLHQQGRWPIIEDIHGQPLDLRVIPPPESASMDNCYLTGFQEGWLGVTNLEKKVGIGLAWDANVFRYVWLWEAFGGGSGYPWYQRTYQLGIEPWTSYPCAGIQEAIRNGTTLSLKPRASLSSWLTAVAYTGDAEPKRILRDGRMEFSP